MEEGDLEDQKNELEVLGSIYFKDEMSLNDGAGGVFYCFQCLPEGFVVVCRDEAEKKTVEIPVSHLPPVVLSFKLPKNYPSQAMPEFTLSCHWLSPGKLQRLCKKLDDLWENNANSVILCTWVEFLRWELLPFLDIDNQLEIKINRANAEDHPPPSTRSSSSNSDPRVISTPMNASRVEQYLKAFDEGRGETIFLRSSYECGVCFDNKKGSDCVKFKPCGHIYCKQCTSDFFKVRILDGTVREMPCPYDKCASQATQKQVKECVGSLLYNKYDKLLLAATLNAMDDVTYCPRQKCNSPVVIDRDEKMAICAACQYVFCTICRRVYHGVAPCSVQEEDKMKLIKEYEQGDVETKKRLEKRFGKKHLFALMEEIKSDAWIESNSKPCPKCRAKIEKNDGCNKMSCQSCNSYFCWLCLAILDNVMPYDHYFDGTSPCRNQLFLGMEDQGGMGNVDLAFFVFEDDDDELLV